MSPPHAVLPYGHPPDAYGHVTSLLQPSFAPLLLMLPMMFAYGQVTVEDDVAYGGCFRNKLLIINTMFLHAQRINLVTAPARRAKKQYSPVLGRFSIAFRTATGVFHSAFNHPNGVPERLSTTQMGCLKVLLALAPA